MKYLLWLPTLSISLIYMGLSAGCQKQTNNNKEQTENLIDSKEGTEVANTSNTSDEQAAHLQHSSESLLRYFPLLPHIEKRLWAELVSAEAQMEDTNLTQGERQKLTQRVQHIATSLKKAHPFFQDENTLTLGEVIYHKHSKQFEIPAVVHYPTQEAEDHPNELELILCTEKGRIHETLFTTTARPLHLELLLHLTGATESTSKPTYQITISLPNSRPIAVSKLIQRSDSKPLASPLSWHFTGSDFTDFYSPDSTGDFILCWQAHDSVLGSTNQTIASGETKLKAKPHPLLEQGTAVKLLLTPTS